MSDTTKKPPARGPLGPSSTSPHTNEASRNQEPVEEPIGAIIDAELVHEPAKTPHMQTMRNEPPVVARLVVEIRSDGSRTIARGALDDAMTGQRVAVEAHGDSPIQLAWALARSIFTAPALAKKTVRALLPGRGLLGRSRPPRDSDTE